MYETVFRYAKTRPMDYLKCRVPRKRHGWTHSSPHLALWKACHVPLVELTRWCCHSAMVQTGWMCEGCATRPRVERTRHRGNRGRSARHDSRPQDDTQFHHCSALVESAALELVSSSSVKYRLRLHRTPPAMVWSQGTVESNISRHRAHVESRWSFRHIAT